MNGEMNLDGERRRDREVHRAVERLGDPLLRIVRQLPLRVVDEDQKKYGREHGKSIQRLNRQAT